MSNSWKMSSNWSFTYVTLRPDMGYFSGAGKHSRNSAVWNVSTWILNCPFVTSQFCSQDLHRVGSPAHPLHGGKFHFFFVCADVCTSTDDIMLLYSYLNLYFKTSSLVIFTEKIQRNQKGTRNLNNANITDISILKKCWWFFGSTLPFLGGGVYSVFFSS